MSCLNAVYAWFYNVVSCVSLFWNVFRCLDAITVGDHSTTHKNKTQEMTENMTHTPLTKKKLLIGGGVIVVIVVIILAATLSTRGGGSDDTTYSGEYVIRHSPLVVGSNDLAERLKMKWMNRIPVKLDNLTDCETDIKRLGNGFVALQVWSVGSSNCTVAQGKDAVTQTLEQIDLMSRIMSNYSTNFLLYKQSSDIQEAKGKKLIGSLLSVSGGHNLDGRTAVLRMFYALGVRAVSLVGNCSTHWGSSANDKTDNGLTDFGKVLVGEMNRLGVVIDLTSSSVKTRSDALDATKAPVIFSNSNAANLSAHPYNLDDTTLDEVKKNGGLVMVSFVASQVNSTSTNISMTDVIRHMTYLKHRIGVDHIGIGGGFDLERGGLAEGLEDVSKFPKLFDRLYDQGWTKEDLEKIAGSNFKRVVTDVEKIAKDLHSKAPSDDYEPLEDYPKTEEFVCYSDIEVRGYNRSSAPMTTVTTQASSTVTTQVPSTNATQVPSTNATQVPSTVTTQVPSTNATQVASTNATSTPTTAKHA